MSLSTFPPSDKRRAIRDYVRSHFGPYRVNLLLIVMKNVIGSFLHMLPPFMSKYVLERVLPQQNLSLLVIISICMVVAPIIGSMMIVLENMWGRFMLQLSSKGRAELYNGIQHRPLKWQRQNRIGDLTTRILDDTHFITDMVNGQIGFMLFHVVTIIAGSAVLLTLQPALGSVVLVLWAGQALLMSSLGRQVKQKAADTARHNSIVAETVRELVSAAPFIKAAGQEATALGNVKECLRQEWEHTRRGVLVDHRVRLIHAALNAISLVLMYTAGGWFVLNETMTVGSLVAFVAVYNWLRPFGISLIERMVSAMKLMPSVDRIAEIAFPVAVGPDSDAIPEGPVTVEAHGLSFQHDGRIILDNISLHLPPGSIVSVVGHRGSGKSTLADLLLGLHEPASGNVRLNGIPLTEIDPAWLRRHMLCVTQDVMLRSGTILDNIVYGSRTDDPEAIREAIRIAELEDWITCLPDGIHTRVGEQALQISGGERQRISIARALLRKPAILILDEATSALDQGTERRLLNRLIQECKGTTFLFITHRLEVGLRSDVILVLNEGRIMDSGNHGELLSRPGIYRELWASQETRESQ